MDERLPLQNRRTRVQDFHNQVWTYVKICSPRPKTIVRRFCNGGCSTMQALRCAVSVMPESHLEKREWNKTEQTQPNTSLKPRMKNALQTATPITIFCFHLKSFFSTDVAPHHHFQITTGCWQLCAECIGNSSTKTNNAVVENWWFRLFTSENTQSLSGAVDSASECTVPLMLNRRSRDRDPAQANLF